MCNYIKKDCLELTKQSFIGGRKQNPLFQKINKKILQREKKFYKKSQLKKEYSMGEKFLRFRMIKDLYIYFFKKGKRESVYLTGNAYHHSIE